MDAFEQQLAEKLKPKTETVTLERVLNFYKFLKSKKMFGSIIWYEGAYSCWATQRAIKTFEGNGATISDALDDILKEFQKCGLF